MATNHVNESKHRLVVAIDFGTYASGYAFQFRSEYECNRSTINTTKWQDGGMRSFKTTTCILLKPDQSIHSFGYAAQKYFATLNVVHPIDHDRWFFFRFFKMILYKKEDLSETTTLEAASGASLPAIVVFSKAIEYLKNHFIKKLHQNGLSFVEKDTRWVLTVPAIWNDKEKQFMRKAAEKAGILAHNLLLALEPEAAAICCNQLPSDQLKIQGDDGKLKYVAAPGSTIMVVDLGGGTVDITTVKIGIDGSMKQVYESSGDDCGGMKVNEKFIFLLHEIVGVHIWEEFSANEKREEHEFIKEFEQKKREIGTEDDSEENFCCVYFPPKLKEIWEKGSHRTVEENLRCLAERLKERVKFTSGRLYFDVNLLKEFFEDSISSILNKITDARSKSSVLGSLDAVILVGGFAESDLVTTRVRAGLEDLRIPVIRPESPEQAVLLGGVLFGHNPSIITTRVLPRTYGVAITVDFIAEKYDEKLKFEAPDGKFYVSNVFEKHAERSQEVTINEWTKPLDYCVDETGQTSTEVYIYTSNEKSPVFTDSDGCEYLGKLSVDFSEIGRPGPATRRNKSIEVSLCFGGTEIKVRAIDKTTRREYKTSLNLI